jgi:dTDP-4-amino-4,6-dideoxygalactose transaminase
MIPFNKPYLSGNEIKYIEDAVRSGKISGNGIYTKKCHNYFQKEYDFKKCLLTTSCTDALEMAAILCDIQPGDEVIVPSYTFVSSALAFIRQGAKIVFADSQKENPNIDTTKLELLITPKTKAIVPVHYAGCSCEMDTIMALAEKYRLIVVEDAAQAINSYYTSLKKGKKLALGSIGHLGCFSFHETKNIISGEGGMLTINDDRFFKRAEIIWEKGTNRAEFFRGEVNKYGWSDIGSSFLPSEITAAFLWAQIENIIKIQTRRKILWDCYLEGLRPLAEKGYFSLPVIPDYSDNNGHLFHLICHSLGERTALITYLKGNGILAVFHYLSLHKSSYYANKHDGRDLPNSDNFADCLVRLPLFYDLTEKEISKIISSITSFYENKKL